MTRRSALLFLLLIAPAAVAQQGAHHQPYAGLQARGEAALSSQEVADLRAGRGMGFALPAELHGFPGPMHVLELSALLGLSPSQRARLEVLMHEMRAETIALGEELIAAERLLDGVFRNGAANAATVNARVETAALARGRVRAAHLRAHLVTHEALSPGQREMYARLRGYTP